MVILKIITLFHSLSLLLPMTILYCGLDMQYGAGPVKHDFYIWDTLPVV